MTLTKFKPRRSVLSDRFFTSPFDALFNDLMVEGTKPLDRFETPKAEVMEDDQKFQISLVMAGLSKKDIKLDVNDNELVVHGEKVDKKEKEEKLENEGRYHLREYRSDKFRRSFFLPDVADTENIKAELKNGILEIQVPKKEKAKPKVISIK